MSSVVDTFCVAEDLTAYRMDRDALLRALATLRCVAYGGIRGVRISNCDLSSGFHMAVWRKLSAFCSPPFDVLEKSGELASPTNQDANRCFGFAGLAIAVGQ